MRICTKCGTEKPLTDFYKKKEGFRRECKQCEIARSRAWNVAHSERVKVNNAAWYAANTERAKATNADWCAANSDRAKATQIAWRAANPDRVKALGAAWYAANMDKSKAANAAWREANAERAKANTAAWRAANLDKFKTMSSAWRVSNPDAARIHHQNRRARKKQAEGKLSKGLKSKLFVQQKGMCPCCKQPLGDDFHMDHVMPLALGGSNTDDNMQLLRKKCNLEKHASHPIDFMQSKGFLL